LAPRHFLPRLKVSAKAQSFCQGSKFLPRLKVSAQALSFCPGSKFLPGLKVSAQAQSFCPGSKFLPRLKVSAYPPLKTAIRGFYMNDFLVECAVFCAKPGAAFRHVEEGFDRHRRFLALKKANNFVTRGPFF
jgi:hypothetical protein